MTILPKAQESGGRNEARAGVRFKGVNADQSACATGTHGVEGFEIVIVRLHVRVEVGYVY